MRSSQARMDKTIYSSSFILQILPSVQFPHSKQFDCDKKLMKSARKNDVECIWMSDKSQQSVLHANCMYIWFNGWFVLIVLVKTEVKFVVAAN